MQVKFLLTFPFSLYVFHPSAFVTSLSASEGLPSYRLQPGALCVPCAPSLLKNACPVNACLCAGLPGSTLNLGGRPLSWLPSAQSSGQSVLGKFLQGEPWSETFTEGREITSPDWEGR